MDVIYDISRLSTRVLNTTPNGIDWIDALLADAFISRSEGPAQLLLFGLTEPRLFQPGRLPNPVPVLKRAWGWDAPPGEPCAPEWLAAAVNGRRTKQGTKSPHASLQRRTQKALRIAGALKTYGLALGSKPAAAAPKGAVYINASHYPLEREGHVAWLEDRPDVRPVIFIHDLLPLHEPQLFWEGEPERHLRRLKFLARRGAGAIVTTNLIADQLRGEMTRLRRDDLPIFVAPPPVVPLFRTRPPVDPRLEGDMYFVVCGTIEPRKNHLLLLEVWRHLVEQRGAQSPKLVIIGKRGWLCRHIVEAINDPALKGTVIEASGLATTEYRSILAQARGLLSPSKAEGFGLPVAEALALGVPVIASDIPAHREQGGVAPLYLDARRTDEWLEAINAFSRNDRDSHDLAIGRASRHEAVDPDVYRIRLTQYLKSLV